MSKKLVLSSISSGAAIISIVIIIKLTNIISLPFSSRELPSTMEDWPMWRFDAGRTAASPHALPAELHLNWIRILPEPIPAWPAQDDDGDKLAFDRSYEPIAYGGKLIVPSMVNDRLTAYDLVTGEEMWRHYSDGPVRFAPVAGDGKVYFSSDDGTLYSLDAESGQRLWKHRGLNEKRKVMGNGRLIDMRPARGGPVLKDGTVYYASGIWPFMGVFIYALDAESGRMFWKNSTSGSTFLSQIHGPGAFGGAAPQGYLVASDDRVLVPNGRSRPAGYRRETGEFLYLNLDSRQFGRGWPGQGGYAVMAKNGYFHYTGETNRLSDGKLVNQVRTPGLEVVEAQSGRDLELNRWPLVDMAVANEEGILGVAKGRLTAYAHQPKSELQVSEPCRRGRTAEHYPLLELWSATVDTLVEKVFIQAENRLYGSGADGAIYAIDLPGKEEDEAGVSFIGRVEGKVWNMLAASGRLVVVTEEGRLYGFGPEKRKAVTYQQEQAEFVVLDSGENDWEARVAMIRQQTAPDAGHVVLLGLGSGRLLEELIRQTDWHVSIIDPDEHKVEAVRRRLDKTGLYGVRATALAGDLNSVRLPPYLADVITSEDPDAAGLQTDPAFADNLFRVLRPYGGAAWLLLETEEDRFFSKQVQEAKLSGAEPHRKEGMSVLTRQGALPGSDDWTHQNAGISNTMVSGEKRVQAPLGLLWFGGPSNDHVLPRHGRGPIPQVSGGRLFILGPHSLGARDVYTGRLLWEKSLPYIGLPYDDTGHQPGADHVGSPYVSLEDAVYIFHDNACLQLDPATGETVSEFRLPSKEGKDNAAWGYIGVWEDKIIAGLEPQFFDEDRPGRDNWNATSSRRIAVLDRHDGTLKWSLEASQGFRHNAIAAANGKLYVLDRLSDGARSRLERRGQYEALPPARLLALDIFTGKMLWERSDALFGTWLAYAKEHDLLLQSGRPATNHRQRIPDEASDRMAVYDAGDGTLIWDRDISYTNPPMLHDEYIYVHGQAFDLFTGEKKTGRHPLTGEPMTAFRYPASSNCAQIISSQQMTAFRRGTAAFSDLSYGMTASLGGFRAGCTPNLVPAGGVLNAPDYTRTCICSYQMQTSLALVSMPEIEYWTINAWEKSPAPVHRGGVNFGAPGDRRSLSGTIWLAYPAAHLLGGTSENVPLFDGGGEGSTSTELLPVSVSPDHPGWLRFQTHSLFLPEDENRWIFASGLDGAEQISIVLNPHPDQEDRLYTVRLYFAEPGPAGPGERLFDVAIQGTTYLQGLDVSGVTGSDGSGKPSGASGATGGMVREFHNIPVTHDLVIDLIPTETSNYPPVISGIEVDLN